MRITISIISTLVATCCFSQRITFNDPDLTFSFKKPKDWQIFDDGLVVKLAPSVSDSSTTYFTITYFEDAKSVEYIGFDSGNSATSSSSSCNRKIVRQLASCEEKNANEHTSRKYTFYKFNQRFELVTQFPNSMKQPNRIFDKIIGSIRVRSTKQQ